MLDEIAGVIGGNEKSRHPAEDRIGPQRLPAMLLTVINNLFRVYGRYRGIICSNNFSFQNRIEIGIGYNYEQRNRNNMRKGRLYSGIYFHFADVCP